MNFYEVTKKDFPALRREIEATLHSRRKHAQDRIVYENPDMVSHVKRAWAVWILANASFAHNLIAGFGYDRGAATSRKIKNKTSSFTKAIADRLTSVTLESGDALKIISSRDTLDSFFYLDPPYVGYDQGHYDGYSQEDFNALLDLLQKIKGKFLLTSFRNTALSVATERHSWHQIELKRVSSMTQKGGNPRQKIEVLTANYPIGIEDNEVTLV